MADISSITLPGGGTYDLKDKNAVPKYGMGKNLLRNWYFVGGGTGRGVFPVNQRGQSSYSANGYRIDGWTSGTHSGTVTLNATGISIYSSPGGQTIIRQLLDLNDELDGKTCTMSVLTANGVFTGTGVLTISATSTNRIGFSVGTTGYVNVTTQTGTPILVDLRATSGNTIEYIATKLELGTEQTLAHQEGSTWVLNEIPDYEYELYRCITSTADSTDTFANKSLATEQQLAYVESGTTASKNYEVGEYFCWNGILHRVISPISSGASFTVGTNCEQASGGAANALRLKHIDITATPSAVGNVQVNSATGNVVTYDNFVNALVIGNTGSTILTRPHTYANLVYVNLVDLVGNYITSQVQIRVYYI